ncbi:MULTISPECIES: patatin-like phospholipase family protein [unclassified Leifsonia]|uniref:patatin-like phospholipase family protein n=1 Tax=unclassified Leifsonia TaxID=2663824 RepID=UPI0006F743A1|nr:MULTISPECIES: patatin-like phospholipase family protein [unclassified Leifsonia]KQX08143.1 patatin [Leifsonia sp. Root1293]KRA12424.1 patatin [Leifsonia sp. Root60]
MNTTSSFPSASSSPSGPGTRALVLGGGGATGNAWLIGMIAGLFESGLDVTTPDLTVGTSAGATVAAQLAGATPPELLAAILSAPQQHQPVAAGSASARSTLRPVHDHLERFRGIIASSADGADMRRRMGAMALAADAASDGSRRERWRATVASRFPGHDWPPRTVLITAVDAETGDGVVFDGSNGVSLIDAVAASTSGGGSAYAIDGRAYIDGGYRRSSENADLAAGHDTVLVLSPLGGRSLYPPEWNMHLAAQVHELRAGGSRVETVFPEGDAEHLLGVNAMDPSLRPAAARAGYDQGRAGAERIAEFWR